MLMSLSLSLPLSLHLPPSFSIGTPNFIKSPEDQIGISGGVASFVCQAGGDPKPRITWMKKGKKVSSQRFEVGAVSQGRHENNNVNRDPDVPFVMKNEHASPLGRLIPPTTESYSTRVKLPDRYVQSHV